MTERPNPAYAGDEPYICVTYAHANSDLAYPQIRWLQDQGFNVWWDEGISPGAAWRAEVAEAIRGCSLLLYFVTPESVISDHCTREVNFALDEHGRPVLAVHLLETLLPGALGLSLSDRQAVLQHALPPEDYERKLVSAVSTYLGQPVPEISTRAPSRNWRRRTVVPVAAAGALLVGIAATWVVMRQGPPEPHSPARFALDLPAGVALPGYSDHPLAISADGQRIVFAGVSQDGNQAYVRTLGALEASPIPGTKSRVNSVYLSPNGESLILAGGDALRKVSIGGGQPVTILQGQGGPSGLSWARDGSLVFSTFFGDPRVMRVPDTGGTPEAVTDAVDGKRHTRPHLLADGSAVLFAVLSLDDLYSSRIEARSFATGEQRTLIDGSNPLVTSSGHLLFTRDGSIWAAPFDADRLEVTGTAAPVLSDVHINEALAPVFSVALDGSMVYLAKEVAAPDTLVWVDPAGNEVPLPAPPGSYAEPRVSPDGKNAALRVGDPNRVSQLWVYSLTRNTLAKLSDGPVFGLMWSADGKQVIYARIQEDKINLYRHKADGTGVEERLTNSEQLQFPTWQSRDGSELFYNNCDASLECDIGRMTLGNEITEELLLKTEYSERDAALSADGRWLAYQSNASGRYEVYVRPYPNIDTTRWQISVDGGRQPVWSPDGNTLYFAAGSSSGQQMMAVEVDVEQELVPGDPQPLFDFNQALLLDVRSHDLHPDGDRFLMVKPGAPKGGGALQFHYVQNWLDEVDRLVPTRR